MKLFERREDGAFGFRVEGRRAKRSNSFGGE